jgi:hypothetical protein
LPGAMMSDMCMWHEGHQVTTVPRPSIVAFIEAADGPARHVACSMGLMVVAGAAAVGRAAGGADIVPIILEGPPPVPPPDSLRNIHFNDVIHCLIAAPRKGLLSKLFDRFTRRRAALH